MTGAPTPHRAASAEERDRREPTDAEIQSEISAEEAARKASLPRAVAPIPVRGRFHLMECEHCGWVGSSELCGTDSGGDDSDIYCPACDAMTLGDEPSEADAAKFGQALLDRITAAEARAEEAKALNRSFAEAHITISETAQAEEARAEAAEARAEEAERSIEQKAREVVTCGLLDDAKWLLASKDQWHAKANAATAGRDRLADEVARLRGALTEIAQATPEPDDKEWRNVWNDPAPYLSVGSTYETSVDTSNQGDMEAFGYEQGIHASAVIARRALTATGGPTDDQA